MITQMLWGKLILLSTVGSALRPGPRIQRGAGEQEIFLFGSLGRRVFRNKVVIAAKTCKLNFFMANSCTS